MGAAHISEPHTMLRLDQQAERGSAVLRSAILGWPVKRCPASDVARSQRLLLRLCVIQSLPWLDVFAWRCLSATVSCRGYVRHGMVLTARCWQRPRELVSLSDSLPGNKHLSRDAVVALFSYVATQLQGRNSVFVLDPLGQSMHHTRRTDGMRFKRSGETPQTRDGGRAHVP